MKNVKCPKVSFDPKKAKRHIIASRYSSMRQPFLPRLDSKPAWKCDSSRLTLSVSKLVQRKDEEMKTHTAVFKICHLHVGQITGRIYQEDIISH